jgi:hypothetical protein
MVLAHDHPTPTDALTDFYMLLKWLATPATSKILPAHGAVQTVVSPTHSTATKRASRESRKSSDMVQHVPAGPAGALEFQKKTSLNVRH